MSLNDQGEHLIDVASVILHPGWNRWNGTRDDLALLRLVTPAMLGPNVQTIRVLNSHSPAPSGLGTMAGWGGTGGFTARVLESAELPVVDNATCDLLSGRDIQPGELCAGYANGSIQGRQGDSGGPFWQADATGVPTLAGVTARFLGGYTVFTSVRDYQDWIRCHVPDLFPEAPSTLPSMVVTPRRIEEAQVAGDPALVTRWTLTASFQSRQMLLIDPMALSFSGAQAASFTVQPERSLPTTVSCDQELDLVVDYTGARADGIIADATLEVVGLHVSSGDLRRGQADLHLNFYAPELGDLPRRVWYDAPAPCGGFGPTDPWTVTRHLVLVNLVPGRQRVLSFQAAGVDTGSISLAASPSGASLPATIEPGQAVALEATWSGTGPIPTPAEEAELVFEVFDVRSGRDYLVRQPQRLTFIEDCSAASLIAPDLVNFGVSEMNRPRSASATIRAHGTANLVISAVRPCSNGPSTQPFAYVGTPPVIVAPGMTASLPFEVTPNSVGVQTGCLELVSNDPRGPHEIALFTVTANRTMEVRPDTLEFGRISDRRVFQVLNTGALPIRLRSSGVTVTGPFSLWTTAGTPFSFSPPLDVPGGGAATIEVRMSGHDGPQPVSGSVALVSNPADGEPTVSGIVTLRYQP